jgi:hypothetical protein
MPRKIIDIPKSKGGRRCQTCFHAKAAEINAALTSGKAMRQVSAAHGLAERALYRHARKCLSLQFTVLRSDAALMSAEYVWKAFEGNLKFATELREAAQKWLMVNDEETGQPEYNLDPRDSEMSVVYLDYEDMTDGKNPQPKKKTELLSELIDRLEGKKHMSVQVVFGKRMDLRKFALDAIASTDMCVDKFAKLRGLYQKEQANERDEELLNLRRKIERAASINGTDYETEKQAFLSEFSDEIKPDLRTQLVSTVQ